MLSISGWIVLVLSAAMFVAAEANLASLPGAIVTQARRRLNFGGMFGSATTASPYDRIAGHPVFQVTTSWGAPYMNFEQIDDPNDEPPDSKGNQKPGGLSNELVDNNQATRPIALYFMDPDDAIQQHEQMKQMSHMKSTDMRITSTTLAKALRQCSNLGNGLPTGVPPDPLSGNLKTMDEGGSLRYKIVPPKRQLFYAARCKGRERVGLFGKTAREDAEMMAGEQDLFRSTFKDRRRDSRDPNRQSMLTPAQKASAHMEGYLGIPVFYAPEMKRVMPKVKQLTSGVKEELPFFFSYEDMMDAWNTMRDRNKKANIPAKPESVEVFNLWDVLTSMEREQWVKKHQNKSWRKDPVGSIRQRFTKKGPDLESITFVPPSRCTEYKEKISAKGNGKARLRPMR